MSDSPLKAILEGEIHDPRIALKFDRSATHPLSGRKLVDWVRGMPGRSWDSERGAWTIYAAGGGIAEALLEAGFTTYGLRMTGVGADAVTEIDDVVGPYARLNPELPNHVEVWPRLLGYEPARALLPKGAAWQKGEGHWRLPIITMLEPLAQASITLGPGVLAAAKAAEAKASETKAGASELARSTGGIGTSQAVADVLANVGDVPEWFGLALDPYQRAGAIAVAAGHRMLCDEPGLGKTRTALAAAAIVGAERTVVVCPPVVVTAWQREATESRLADHCSEPPGTNPVDVRTTNPDPSIVPRRSTKRGDRPPKAPKVPDKVVMIRSGRKQPALPVSGIVVVPDTLLAARPALVDELVAWRPDAVLVDEAHREKTWTSGRARAVRKLAAAARLLPVAITGTPLFANPVELASPLAIAAHLDETFGGFGAFRPRYAKQNPFHAWMPIKARLPELRQRLDASVWVRRTKADVLSDLPPKRRLAKIVDVDPSLYRHAHAEVIDEINVWLDSLEENPTSSEVLAWSNESVGMITRLRRAAGLAKVPVAVDMIVDWVAETGTTLDDNGETVFTRPLVVWTHHREVSDAMAHAVPEAVGTAGVIMGGTPHEKRAQLVDDFQAGKIPVLVCSIHAAGVGITLTRSSDVLFVETDWTPAIVSQAEDRCHRRTQVLPVTITTLIAPDTLDERVQAVLKKKIGILDSVLTGADHHVSVLDSNISEAAAPSEILAGLVNTCLVSRAKRQKNQAT